LKRQLKKKRIIANAAKEVLPSLKAQLLDEEMMHRIYKEDIIRNGRQIVDFKAEVDRALVELLQQEGIELNKKQSLESVIDEVDNCEAENVYWTTEKKRQAQLIAVLSAQRDIKARESARVEENQKEARILVGVKELSILDLTKRCGEISNRLKEFSALYEVVKNERNKYVNLIQSSAQALAEMKEKIRILNNEVKHIFLCDHSCIMLFYLSYR
jgi:hypothetical protein